MELNDKQLETVRCDIENNINTYGNLFHLYFILFQKQHLARFTGFGKHFYVYAMNNRKTYGKRKFIGI